MDEFEQRLIKTCEILARGWTQRAYARRAGGWLTRFDADDAVEFCISGGFLRSGSEIDVPDERKQCLVWEATRIADEGDFGRFVQAFEKVYGMRPERFNDHHCQTQAAAIEAVNWVRLKVQQGEVEGE